MHVVLVYNGLCSGRIFICAQNWEFADLLRFWGDKASCLQLKGAWFAIVPDPLDIDHYKDSYNSGGKKSRWDVEEDEAAGANDAMQEIDEGEEEELEDDEEIPLENLPGSPQQGSESEPAQQGNESTQQGSESTQQGSESTQQCP